MNTTSLILYSTYTNESATNRKEEDNGMLKRTTYELHFMLTYSFLGWKEYYWLSLRLHLLFKYIYYLDTAWQCVLAFGHTQWFTLHSGVNFLLVFPIYQFLTCWLKVKWNLHIRSLTRKKMVFVNLYNVECNGRVDGLLWGSTSNSVMIVKSQFMQKIVLRLYLGLNGKCVVQRQDKWGILLKKRERLFSLYSTISSNKNCQLFSTQERSHHHTLNKQKKNVTLFFVFFHTPTHSHILHCII